MKGLKNIIWQGKRETKTLLCLALVILMILMVGFANGKHVEIDADGRHIEVTTLYSTPESILKQAGITLQEKDEYRLSTAKVKNNTVITIYRAVPVTVEYQGKKQEIITGKPTVGELLNELGYGGDGYTSVPGADAKIQENLNIEVKAVTEKIIEREEQDDYTVVYQPDTSMEKGTQRIAQQGHSGVKKVKVKETYHDGVKTAEETLESVVIDPAQPQIVMTGARDTVETSRGAMRFSRAVTMNASAYLPSDGGGNGITATGMAARQGVVAVDPRVIPLGTRLYIPGYGLAIAGDTGGAIVGNRIDLCMESYGAAMSFGRRAVKVYILE